MEEKENKQENADIFRLTPIKERTLRREIHTWGHLSFRWDIQLTNGEYFEGPSGMIYKIVGANGEISTVKPGTVPSSSVKEHPLSANFYHSEESFYPRCCSRIL